MNRWCWPKPCHQKNSSIGVGNCQHDVWLPWKVVVAHITLPGAWQPWGCARASSRRIASAPIAVQAFAPRTMQTMQPPSAKPPHAPTCALSDALEDASNELPGIARLALQQAFTHWRAVEEQMRWCEQRIAEHARQDEQARRACELLGTASAAVACVADFSQFKSAKQFGGWLGLVPSQNSSGGKARLGRITKRGDAYLRTLLIQGAKSVVMSAAKRSDHASQWVLQLKELAGWQKAVVALANKNARILWCVMTRDTAYDPGHVPMLQGAT